MLADLERRLRREPAVVRERVRLERADMRAWHAERRFRLIIAPFNTLLHLYTQRDIQRFLARVRRHLAQGGSFACDCSMPSSDELSGRVRRTRPRRIWHPSRKTWVDYSESFEYDPDRQLLLIWFSFTPRDGGPGWAVPLTHRQLFPCELEASLCYAGFRQVTLGGDFRPGAAGTDVRSVLARCW
jgi:hypothetical protein